MENKLRRHDGDCQIFRTGVCTCGYLHRILPYAPKWTEKDADELARHEFILETLFRINDSLKMPLPKTKEEIEKLDREFRETWKSLGGRIETTYKEESNLKIIELDLKEGNLPFIEDGILKGSKSFVTVGTPAAQINEKGEVEAIPDEKTIFPFCVHLQKTGTTENLPDVHEVIEEKALMLQQAGAKQVYCVYRFKPVSISKETQQGDEIIAFCQAFLFGCV